jgi:YebC/PmpR family DNA-binding regulatory protein
MSGHSKWATTKHQKSISDTKRAKIFTKMQREICVAARTGDTNPNFNPRLRNAILAAKAVNMPREKIEIAIRRANTPTDGENYEEIRYEGYAPGAVALLVEVLTENRNRTVANIRSYFTKSGGVLGETGSVSYMFTRVGLLEYDVGKNSSDQMLEAALEAGASDVQQIGDRQRIITSMDDFVIIRNKLLARLGEPREAGLTWIPKNTLVLDTMESVEKVLKLVEKLEDDDDVQRVIGNFEVDDRIVEQLSG